MKIWASKNIFFWKSAYLCEFSNIGRKTCISQNLLINERALLILSEWAAMSKHCLISHFHCNKINTWFKTNKYFHLRIISFNGENSVRKMDSRFDRTWRPVSSWSGEPNLTWIVCFDTCILNYWFLTHFIIWIIFFGVRSRVQSQLWSTCLIEFIL